MSLQFQPPPQKREKPDMLDAISVAAQTVPQLWRQYQADKRENAYKAVNQQLELLKLSRGQTVYDPTTGKQMTVPGLTGYRIDFGNDGVPKLIQEEGASAGSQGLKMIPNQAKGGTRTQIKMTSTGLPVIFDPVNQTLTMQGTGETYDPEQHGKLILGNQSQPMLPSGETRDLADLTTAREQLRTLIDSADESGFGTGNPYVEKARASDKNPLRPLDENASTFNQVTALTKQIIGKGLEGGVLRKEDEIKYDKIIPRPGNSQAILRKKADQLDKLILTTQKTRAREFEKAGWRGVPDTPVLPPIPAPRQGSPKENAPASPSPTPPAATSPEVAPQGIPQPGQQFNGARVLRVRRVK
jgi:hypothetical protein